MFNLQDVSGLSGCFVNAGLAIATTTSKFKTTNTIKFAIGGKIYSYTNTDNITPAMVTGSLPTLNAGGTAAGAQACVFLVVADSSANIKVVQGPVVSGGEKAPVPATPDGYAAIGAIKVDSGSSLFTLGTTALTGGTVTVTYVDYAANPGGAI